MGWVRAVAWAMLIVFLLPGARAGAEEVRPATAGMTVGLIAGGAGSTDTEIAAEMAHVLAEEARLRVLPMLGQGPEQTLSDLANLRNADVAIMHTDALTDLVTRHAPRSGSLEYIAKLFQEEVHVLAQQPVTSLADLAGKPVEVGPVGSDTAFTAQAVLSALHITPELLHDPDIVALERLRLGQAAAVIIVGGKPVPALLRIPPASGLHFLPVPLTAQLVDTYLPSTLESQAYPGLVRPGETVETVAVGAVLVTLTGAGAGGEAHARRVERFVDMLFTRFDQFHRPGFHPKWRDVSLTAQIAGLKRYGAAERRLQEARH